MLPYWMDVDCPCGNKFIFEAYYKIMQRFLLRMWCSFQTVLQITVILKFSISMELNFRQICTGDLSMIIYNPSRTQHSRFSTLHFPRWPTLLWWWACRWDAYMNLCTKYVSSSMSNFHVVCKYSPLSCVRAISIQAISGRANEVDVKFWHSTEVTVVAAEEPKFVWNLAFPWS